MKKVFVIALFLFSVTLFAQNKEPKLLGIVSEDELKKEPYSAWFLKNYEEYQPNQSIIAQLKNYSPEGRLSNFKIKIFFGTWCGDTKRELPRMMKVLNQIGFPKNKITFIAVDNEEHLYKQSPTHEQKGMNIYRVPTFIIYEKDKEIARINELPVQSTERDLLQILKRQLYVPNYTSHDMVDSWLKQGLLSDENLSAAGLARQARSAVVSEGELNSCGYVLMAQNNFKEAINVFRINANLFPKSANCYDSLAEGYLKVGNKAKALAMYENALKLDSTNKEMIEKIEKLKKEMTN
jgi:tetratricopeptide (TPR) repeat protein